MRKINEIAAEIGRDWKDISNNAFPYYIAMRSIEKPTDTWLEDDGYMVIRKFLLYSEKWEGDVARKIKNELKTMLN